MPKLTAAIAISYSNENAALATTQAQFAQLSFTARKQGQIIQISNELIRDSVPAADQILQQHAVRWMALDRDKQLILGNGQSGAPIGLWNIGGAAVQNSLGIQNGTLATGQSPLYTELVTGIINVETLNGLSTNVPLGMATCTGVLGMPALKQQILNIKDSNGRPLYDFQGLNAMRGSFPASGGGQFDGLLGVPAYRFSQVFNQAAGSRYITFGDWQWLIYMVRQDVEVMVSNVAGTSFSADQTWIRLISRYDVGVAHPEAFYGYTNG
jgi:HK97 family phage major capsid protein